MGRQYLTDVKDVSDALAARIPAPPELIARAEDCVREFGGCFWFWHPEARLCYLDDVGLVIKHLREYGDRKAWQAAQELQQCL